MKAEHWIRYEALKDRWKILLEGIVDEKKDSSVKVCPDWYSKNPTKSVDSNQYTTDINNIENDFEKSSTLVKHDVSSFCNLSTGFKVKDKDENELNDKTCCSDDKNEGNKTIVNGGISVTESEDDIAYFQGSLDENNQKKDSFNKDSAGLDADVSYADREINDILGSESIEDESKVLSEDGCIEDTVISDIKTTTESRHLGYKINRSFDCGEGISSDLRKIPTDHVNNDHVTCAINVSNSINQFEGDLIWMDHMDYYSAEDQQQQQFQEQQQQQPVHKFASQGGRTNGFWDDDEQTELPDPIQPDRELSSNHQFDNDLLAEQQQQQPVKHHRQQQQPISEPASLIDELNEYLEDNEPVDMRDPYQPVEELSPSVTDIREALSEAMFEESNVENEETKPSSCKSDDSLSSRSDLEDKCSENGLYQSNAKVETEEDSESGLYQSNAKVENDEGDFFQSDLNDESDKMYSSSIVRTQGSVMSPSHSDFSATECEISPVRLDVLSARINVAVVKVDVSTSETKSVSGETDSISTSSVTEEEEAGEHLADTEAALVLDADAIENESNTTSSNNVGNTELTSELTSDLTSKSKPEVELFKQFKCIEIPTWPNLNGTAMLNSLHTDGERSCDDTRSAFTVMYQPSIGGSNTKCTDDDIDPTENNKETLSVSRKFSDPSKLVGVLHSFKCENLEFESSNLGNFVNKHADDHDSSNEKIPSEYDKGSQVISQRSKVSSSTLVTDEGSSEYNKPSYFAKSTVAQIKTHARTADMISTCIVKPTFHSSCDRVTHSDKTESEIQANSTPYTIRNTSDQVSVQRTGDVAEIEVEGERSRTIEASAERSNGKIEGIVVGYEKLITDSRNSDTALREENCKYEQSLNTKACSSKTEQLPKGKENTLKSDKPPFDNDNVPTWITQLLHASSPPGSRTRKIKITENGCINEQTDTPEDCQIKIFGVENDVIRSSTPIEEIPSSSPRSELLSCIDADADSDADFDADFDAHNHQQDIDKADDPSLIADQTVSNLRQRPVTPVSIKQHDECDYCTNKFRINFPFEDLFGLSLIQSIQIQAQVSE